MAEITPVQLKAMKLGPYASLQLRRHQAVSGGNMQAIAKSMLDEHLRQEESGLLQKLQAIKPSNQSLAEFLELVDSSDSEE